MAKSSEYLAFIMDQLSAFEGVEPKRMFGGTGLFKEGLMFGMIGGDVFRLKVDDINKDAFEAKGMKPYHSASKKKGMPYWEVPLEIIEDKEELVTWAEHSYQAALRGKK